MTPHKPARLRRGLRGRRSRRGTKQLFVVAALIERGGRVLLSQRRADQSWPLCWEFPGGKVETGELPEAALAREIREELGCVIRVGEVLAIVRHAYPDFELVMPVYRATLVRGVPRAVTVAAVAWVPRRRLPELTMPPADVPFARKLASPHFSPPSRSADGRAG